MPSNEADVVWLDARHTLTLVELADQSGLSVSELTELVECGVFTPARAAEEPHRYPAQSVVIARTAARLRSDFEVPASSLGLAVRLVERIRELEAEIQDLRARMPGFRR